MMTIKSLGHVTVQVADVARAVALYRDVFGMTEMPRPGLDFPGAWFRCGDVQLHVVGQERPDPPSRRHYALVVTSLADARRAAEAAGLKCSPDAPAPDGRRFFVVDPDNNRWEIIEQTAG
jgi:catechol 2,3-dioxygenase-like lactoylglutathione lyase family enzyme